VASLNLELKMTAATASSNFHLPKPPSAAYHAFLRAIFWLPSGFEVRPRAGTIF